MRRARLWAAALLGVAALGGLEDMAAAFRSAGTIQGATTSLTVSNAPAGISTNDIEFLAVETMDEAVTLTTANGFAQVPDSPQSAASGTATIATRLTLFWRRYSGQAAPVVADAGNHVVCQRYAFSGCILSGNPWDVTAGAVETTEDTSGSAPGDTTTVDNTLIACFLAQAKPDSAGTAEMSSPANGDLAGVAERADNAEASGNGGWLGLITGSKASAGTFGNTTWTGATASFKAMITIALKEEPVTAPFTQSHFRVRSGDDQGLNTDAGWAAALDTNVSMDVEKPFRIRFEVETNDGTNHASVAFKLQYNRNGTGWVDLTAPGWPIPTAVVAVGIIPSAQFADGDATTNILSGSGQTFLAGSGQEDNTWGALANFQNEHSEFECCLLIRKMYQTEENNPAGTTFQFRLVRASDNAVFAGGTNQIPTITVTWPDYLIGGCPAETQWRTLIRDGNGNLYAILEHHEINPTMVVMKSSDGGKSWVPKDSANNPTLNDLECVDAVLAPDGVIHIVHMRSQNTVNYHQFRTSTHATNPDTWGTKDEQIAPDVGSTLQQCCCIERRSNGDLIVFYIAVSGADHNVLYRKKTAGAWGSAVNVDVESGVDFLGVACVMGESDRIQVIYCGQDGNVWHRSLSSADSLSARENLTAGGAAGEPQVSILQPVYWNNGADQEVVVVGYIKNWGSDGQVYSRSILDDTSPQSEAAASASKPSRNRGGGSQVAAFLVADEQKQSVFLVQEKFADGDLYVRTNTSDDGVGGWGSGQEFTVKSNITAEIMTAALFTHGLQGGGARVIGICYDDGADGHTGFYKYTELVVEPFSEPTPTYRRRGE